MSESIAIVLHGPPGVGKSTVAAELMKLRPDAALVSLDDGWSMGERPLQIPGRKYLDLWKANPLLLIELACGEPADLNHEGATRGAEEWVRQLRGNGRKVLSFLLWADWSDAVQRLSDRHRKPGGWPYLDFMSQCGVYALYEHRHPFVTFPPMPAFSETTVLTTGRTPNAVAVEILKLAGIADG